jgi:copper chaperone CopZ
MNEIDQETKKESFTVEGMTCSGCERTVQRVVSNLPGVKSAKAELASASVSLEYDPSKVSVHQIKAAVDQVGYKLLLTDPKN